MMDCFLRLSLLTTLRLLLAFNILVEAVAHSPAQAKVFPYGYPQDALGRNRYGPVLNRPSHRLRMERRAILAVDTVSTLSTLVPETTAVADHTLPASLPRTSHFPTRSREQPRPTASSSATLAPQEKEVALWPFHVRLGSAQKDFVSWRGSGGLLALGILGTIALMTTLALRIHITRHLLLILLTCLVLMIGTSIDLSMGVASSLGENRSYGRCICAALAYAEATWATYAWVYLVIFHKSTAVWLSPPSRSILMTGKQRQDQPPEAVRTTRLMSVVLTFLIGLFEVCWRATLVHQYSIGWHLQQTSVMVQFIFSLLVGIPLARSCTYEWVECQQVREVPHWLATSCLFIGWAIGTGRLAAALRTLGFCESPLGRLLWLLQLVCSTVTAISLSVMENRQSGNPTGDLKGVVIEKPLPCIPSESHNGRLSTNGRNTLSERTGPESARAMEAASGLSAGHMQDLALMRTPRRKQPLVESANGFPVPPSTPAGVPSSVYLPAETPSMYLDSMRAEYLASGPRERAISLPLNRLPTTPSSHGAGLSLSDFGMSAPTPSAGGAKLSHRGRSSSLGDALTRRTSHDTFMAMKRRYEGRAQADKHRRARSASSDMTHLTVTSFFNQFPAPSAMLPIPFHLNQHNRGQSGITPPRHTSRPSSISGREAGSPAHSRSRSSRPFTGSKLCHSVFGGGCVEDGSSGSGDTHQDLEDHCGFQQQAQRVRINSLLSIEGVALTNDGEAVSAQTNAPSHSLDKAEVQRTSTASTASTRRSRRQAMGHELPGTVLETSGDGSMVTDGFGLAFDMCPFLTDQADPGAACEAERTAARATRESKGRSVTFSIEEEGREAARGF